MKELMLTVFAAGFFSTQVIVIAIIVIALIVIIGAVFVLRSGKSKKASTPAAATGNAAWQQQQQQPGNWNQPAGANSWGQPGQPGQPVAGQPAGSWGAPNTSGQPAGSWGAQQQPNNPWAAANPAQAQQQEAWGATPQQPNNPWAAASPPQAQQQEAWGATPQQANNQWGQAAAGQANTGQANNSWGATSSPQQSNNPWPPQGGQGGQSPWEAAPAAAPAAQEAWGQTPTPAPQDPWAQGGGGQQGWGAPSPMNQAPQAPNGIGANTSGASWEQPQQQADPWAAQMQGGPQAGQGWPQGNMGGQQAGFGPGAYGTNDNDKTMLRTTGAPQMGLGYVRVEEGKEPGRTYDVRKESLSIGRSRESDIFLEDLAVSRLHASVVNLGNGNYALKDEGSANGTKVNGQLVNKFQTYPLQEGDRIQLGQTVLVFGRK